MKKIGTILIYLIVTVAVAQSPLERAAKLQKSKDYAGAIEILKKSVAKNPAESYDMQVMLATLYEQLGDYSHAMEIFQELKKIYPSDYKLLLKLAHVYLSMEKYEDAREAILGILKDTLYGFIDKGIIQEAKSLYNKLIILSQCALQNKDIVVDDLVEVNSDYSDYGIALRHDTLFFTSLRKEAGDPIDHRTLQGYSKIFATPLYSESFSKRPIIKLTKLSKYKQNEACPSFTADGKTMYFTKTKPNKSFQIYKATLSGLHIEKIVPVHIPGVKEAGHPAIHPTGKWLVFVSRQNGKDADLFITSYDEKKGWQEAQRLPDIINSNGDELFPVWLNDSVLSFSSNRAGGLGGLDIYVTKLVGGKWYPPVQLSAPVNSAADDFNLVTVHDLKGLFVSNRFGSKGYDDIFMYTGYPFKPSIKVFVYDSITRKPIAGAYVMCHSNTLITDSSGTVVGYPSSLEKVYLKIGAKGYVLKEEVFSFNPTRSLYPDQLEKKYFLKPNSEGNVVEGTVKDAKTNKPIANQDVLLVSQQGFFDKTKTSKEGNFRFTNVKEGNEYTLLVAKKGYWTHTKTFTLPNLPYDAKFNEKNGFDFNLKMQPIEMEEEYVIENIYYDFDKATLRPESKLELDKLVELLKKNPNLVVEINAHTDERGSDEYNMKLSQARAESVVSYLIEKGISSDRLIPKGYGKTRPVVPKAKTEEEHQLNRRTSFRILDVKDITPEELLYLYNNSLSKTMQSRNYIYKVQVAVAPKPIVNENYFASLKRKLPDLIIIEEKHPDGFYHYIAGTFTSQEEAQQLRKQILKAGFSDCYILVFEGNQKIK